MRILGIEAHYPKRKLSRPAPGHEIYLYLLRGLSIERPNRKCCNYARSPRLVTRRSEPGLPDAEKRPKHPGVSEQVGPGNSQNLAFANHVYRLNPFQ